MFKLSFPKSFSPVQILATHTVMDNPSSIARTTERSSSIMTLTSSIGSKCTSAVGHVAGMNICTHI